MPVGTKNFPTSLDTVLELVEVTNDASTALNGALTINATTITVDSTSLFPSSGIITIDSENISYTGKTSTTFTGCTRAAESTTAATHDDNATVELLITAALPNVHAQAIIAVETKLGIDSSTPSANKVLRATGTGTSAWGAIVNADIDASASIAVSKLAALTASRLPVLDASGFLSASSVTATEAEYLSGVTSAIQTQLDAKQAAFGSQTANYVYAGPTTGGAASPSFRALVAADIPSHNQAWSTITSTPATLSGYGITDAQPLDSDLTAIAALTTTSFGRGLLAETDAASLKTTLSLNNVENTALSTWAGSTNITTLGTISAGTWNGTAIGAQYGGTGLNTSASTGYPSLSTGTWSIVSATTLTAALNAMVGDSGSGGTKGLVPAPASGDAAASKFLKADGTWTAVSSVSAANPTASVGLAAMNGSAGTFMRSDGAPALDQGIAPTWTGLHVFTPTVTTGNGLSITGTPTSGNLLNIAATGTAAASNTKTALNVSTSGANATSTMTTYGAQIANTSTGTSSTNIALNLSASGGTNNYALNVSAGQAIFPDGSAGTPSVAGTNTKTSGLYFSGASPAITVSGTLRAYWDADNLHVYNGGLSFSSSADVGFIRSGTNTVRVNKAGASPSTTGAGNLLLATAAATNVGTSGAGVLAFSLSTAPSSSPADMVQAYSGDAAAGAHELYTRNEAGEIERQTGLTARNSAQFDKTNNTLANITGLSRNVEASRTYAFRAILQTTSDVAAGVKFAVSGTATATAISYEGILYEGTTIAAKTRSTALDGVVGAVTAVTAATVVIEGVIQVNAAGTLTIQFAQNATNAAASSVLANQYFQLIPSG